MLDVDTEPARVAVPGGASPAEIKVMWQQPPAPSLDCFFDRIHDNPAVIMLMHCLCTIYQT